MTQATIWDAALQGDLSSPQVFSGEPYPCVSLSPLEGEDRGAEAFIRTHMQTSFNRRMDSRQLPAGMTEGIPCAVLAT